MASMHPALQGHIVVSTDSLIATVLPKLGSAPELGRLRLTGNLLSEMHHREDLPSLAGFIKKALIGGWVTPAHRKLFTFGDDSAALRTVAHDIAWHLGQQVKGSHREALPEETCKQVHYAIAPNIMSRVDLVPLLKIGVELGMCSKGELRELIGNDPGAESRLHDWWISCLLKHIQGASPLAHKRPCMISTELISTRVSTDDPDAPAEVVFRWGLAQVMTAAVLNLPTDDNPENINLRDLILLLSGATQAVAIDFLAPYDVLTQGLGYVWEDDFHSILSILGDTPPTANRVYEIVMSDLPERELENGTPDLGTIIEHTGYESLFMQLDAIEGAEDVRDTVRSWCADVAKFLTSQAFIRNPLLDVDGLRNEDGKFLPCAVMDHVQGRIDAELPSIRRSHPAVGETLWTWAEWLSAHVAAGGEAAEWEVMTDQDYEDAIPIPNLIHAFPGIHTQSELQYAEQIHEELMNGASSMASIFLSEDNLGNFRNVLTAASSANTLIHILNELSEQMDGEVYATNHIE